jgi:dTDP-D-glucose 4,6-dehydratase
VINLPLPQDDPRRRRPDISRAKAILGWEPKVELQDGLEATVEWFSDEQHRSAFFGGQADQGVGRSDLIDIAAE